MLGNGWRAMGQSQLFIPNEKHAAVISHSNMQNLWKRIHIFCKTPVVSFRWLIQVKALSVPGTGFHLCSFLFEVTSCFQWKIYSLLCLYVRPRRAETLALNDGTQTLLIWYILIFWHVLKGITSNNCKGIILAIPQIFFLKEQNLYLLIVKVPAICQGNI